ncbi:MAG: SCO family protein [Planctomycetaceae bacterium]
MLRRPLFWVGTVLWIAVIILFFQMKKEKPQDAVDTASSKNDQEVKLVPAEKENLWPEEGLPDFSLTAHTGETVTKETLIGSPWVVDFIFTYCQGPCPKISAQMAVLQEELKETNVKLITITVDPETDTVEQLEKYAKAYGADPERWLMLTGDHKEIYDLIEKGFLMPVQIDPDADPGSRFVHTTNILYVDEKGVVREKANGIIDSEVVALRRKLVKQYGPEKEEAEAAESEAEPASN